MSVRSPSVVRATRLLLVGLAATSVIACADATAPTRAPELRRDDSSFGDSTTTPPCDTLQSRCHPTQPWG